jgi:anthranilate synthase component 1
MGEGFRVQGSGFRKLPKANFHPPIHQSTNPLNYSSFLYDQLTPIAIYSILKERYPQKISFLFESAISSEEGNFSFIFIDSKERVQYKNNTTTYTNTQNQTSNIKQSPFEFLKDYYKKLDKSTYQNLTNDLNIGFVDGFIGYIGYESITIFEPTLHKSIDDLKDELNIPDIDLIRPKLTLVFSHKTNKLTIISNDESYKIETIIDTLKQPYTLKPIQTSLISEENGNFSFSKEQFFDMVKQSKAMIKSGDVFQILMANRFTQKANIDKLSFYRVLRSKNPSPYMFLLDFNDFSIIGSSPEVMVGLKNNEILLRPIAGTRKRGKNEKRDKELEIEMLNDEKERSEHIMLVDLGRNDVGRVAKTGTVKVTELMRVERYSHVMHLVSDVYATIDPKFDMFDLLAATFTAGTMTGAPKIRAMELIAQFEAQKRNFYSGVVGYFGFDGNMDSSIAIRTAYLDNEKIVFQAGAGVVADSKEELEYLEVHNKLGAMMDTLKELRAQS